MTVFRFCGTLIGFLFATILQCAVPSVVGLATAKSQFTVGRSTVGGQATLFEGDNIQTSYLSTRVALKDGSSYLLGIDSEAAVYRDRIALHLGSVEIINKGKPIRLTAGSVEIVAEKPNSSAIVYVSEKDKVTVLARNGDVRVSKSVGPAVARLTRGQLVTFQPDTRGGVKMDSDGALSDVSRVQSEQLAVLADASKSLSCLAPKVQQISDAFGGLASQWAANQAARNVLLARLDRGSSNAADLDHMASLDGRLKFLTQASGVFSEDLDNVAYQFHHPGPPEPYASPHTIHGHVPLPHHGQHGHSVDNVPPGHLPAGHHL